MLLKTSHISQESTYVKVSFLINPHDQNYRMTVKKDTVICNCRSSHRRCSKKMCCYKFRKICHPETKRPQPATLLEKRLWHWCFPVNFAKFFRMLLLQNTSLVTASATTSQICSRLKFVSK